MDLSSLQQRSPSFTQTTLKLKLVLVLLFSILGFAVMGYHPGLEDDGIYLAAIKSDLNPALFPFDQSLFRFQVQATVFDSWMAHFVRGSGVPLAWAELFWQFTSLFAILWACHSIARRLFRNPLAHWSGVALVAAMFTLPVAGTALYMLDQHLHPRTISTAFILLAVSRILADRRWQAVPLLLLAFLFHPIMGAMGGSFCFFLTMAMMEPVHLWIASWRETGQEILAGSRAMAFVPLAWIFDPPNPLWRKALDTRTYYYLYKWTWYEWLGALVPLAFFGLIWLVAEKKGEKLLARFALAVFAYGLFQQAVAMIMLAPASLVRLTPLQPMRYLHLVYFFMMLMAGCLLGKYVLKASAWRWAVFLLAINSGMFFWQLSMFRGSEHLEFPATSTANPWLEAFSWIRGHTPVDAYFALDPHYLEAPGEDFHGFRALAERSQLADAVKDTAVVTQVPELAPTWDRQVEAQAGWGHFEAADFQRLKREFGVNWVVVRYPEPAGLDCRWHSRDLAVCAVP